MKFQYAVVTLLSLSLVGCFAPQTKSRARKTALLQRSAASVAPLVFYPADNNHHQIGRSRGRGWEVDVSMPDHNYLSYGPYTREVQGGRNRVTFTLSLDNVDNDTLPILAIEAYNAEADQILASRTLQRNDFQRPFADQDLSLDFDYSGQGLLEFRVFWLGNSYAYHAKTTVSRIGDAAPPAPGPNPGSGGAATLDALWNGQAHFEYRQHINWPTANENSAWTVVKDGQWFIFNRETEFAPRPDYCGGLDYARTVARVSTDQGRTWSDKVVVAEPDPSNPDANCAILDGSTYFDRDTRTWHMLTQCLGTSRQWQLCHFTRRDLSPLGQFTPSSREPVVPPGALWRAICDGEGKRCPTSVIDEGTPDILYKKNGYFYVTFHGYDPGPRTGYRGVARTRDFHHWETAGDDLPNDAMYGPRDCASWNPGCIGGGEATTVVSGGYHYMMIEGPDRSLACTDDQYWVFGLMRAPGLWRSGDWESFPLNPFLKPSHRRLCGLQYARFIVDGADTFLLYEDQEKGRRLFQLMPGGGSPLWE